MSDPLDVQQTPLDVQQTLDHCIQAMKSASKAMAVNGRRAGRAYGSWCVRTRVWSCGSWAALQGAPAAAEHPGCSRRIRPADAELALLTMRAAKGGTMLNPPRRTARGEELTGDERCSSPGDGRVRHQRPAHRIVASAGTCGRDRFGIDDRWPVVREPCTQWVLQDAFAAAARRTKTPGYSSRIPPRSSLTVTFSVTWPTMSASSPPTGPPWPRCMSGGARMTLKSLV